LLFVKFVFLQKKQAMKTKYFTKWDIDDDDKKAIESLQDMDDDLFILIETYLKNQNSLPWSREDTTKELTKISNISSKILIEAYDALFMIIHFFMNAPEDSVHSIIEDLQVTNPDCIKDKNKLEERFSKINGLMNIYRPLLIAHKTKREGTPFLSDFKSSVIIKPIFDNRFEYGETEIKNYTPKIIQKVTCAAIIITNSSDDSLSFIVDSKNFDRFLNELISLQIELKIAENECK